MFRVTRYPMISKTELGRVRYQKKYRVAGQVQVPAGHCIGGWLGSIWGLFNSSSQVRWSFCLFLPEVLKSGCWVSYYNKIAVEHIFWSTLYNRLLIWRKTPLMLFSSFVILQICLVSLTFGFASEVAGCCNWQNNREAISPQMHPNQCCNQSQWARG